jgi:Glycosyl transferase family 2
MIGNSRLAENLPDAAMVSVILPTLDCARFIEASLRSIKNQDFRNFECLVLDGGSSDGTLDVIKRCINDDPRFHLDVWPGSSLVSRLNKGIDLSKAALIARMDSDDIAEPNRFALQIKAFSQRPALVLLGGQTKIINEGGVFLRQGIYPLDDAALREKLLTSCPFCHPTVMVRRLAIEAVSGYREAFESAEDHDLWLRLAQVGEIANLPDQLIQYRQHSHSMGSTLAGRQALVSAYAIEAHHARQASQSEQEWIDAAKAASEIGTDGPGVSLRMALNHHRMVFLGDSLRSLEGRQLLQKFLTTCETLDKAYWVENKHNIAEMLVRAMAQLVRFGHYRETMQLLIWFIRNLPLASSVALSQAIKARLLSGTR